MAYMTQEDVIAEAHRVQQLKKAPAVVVIAIQDTQCPFGFAAADGLGQIALSALPRVLRELADKIESNPFPLSLAKPNLA